MTPLYRVLIVGAGKIAGGFDAHRADHEPPLSHAKAYLQHGGFKITVVAEPDPERRETFAQRWKISDACDSLAALRQRAGDFDVISICSSTYSHASDLEAAIALRPRLIFCEKPVTTSVENTRRWVNACEQANVLLAVAHLRRWAPDIVRLQSELRHGYWGKVRSVHATYNKGVLNNGSHMLDLLQCLFGDLTVTAVGRPVVDAFPDDPSVPALLTAGDGMSIHLGSADAADYAHFDMEIITEKGVISMENGGARWRFRNVINSAIYGGYRELEPGTIIPGDIQQAFRCAVQNIYAALTEAVPLASTGRTALTAQILCEQLREASRTGADTHSV